MYVVEPLLEVLGWPRRLDGETGDGAWFEYPVDKAADVALMASSRLYAFGELKQDEYGCKRDIVRHRGKFRELQPAGVTFASWFRDGGGFAVYRVAGDGSPEAVEPDAPVSLKLAQLAKPVLMGHQSAEEWSDTAVETAELPQPRVSIRSVVSRVFGTMTDRLGLPRDRPFRHRAITNLTTEADDGTPSITFVHMDLHPYLPKGWGVTLSIDVIRNIVVCNFFERSVNALKKPRCRLTFGRSVDAGALDEFLGRLLEAVNERRDLAMARGMF